MEIGYYCTCCEDLQRRNEERYRRWILPRAVEQDRRDYEAGVTPRLPSLNPFHRQANTWRRSPRVESWPPRPEPQPSPALIFEDRDDGDDGGLGADFTLASIQHDVPQYRVSYRVRHRPARPQRRAVVDLDDMQYERPEEDMDSPDDVEDVDEWIFLRNGNGHGHEVDHTDSSAWSEVTPGDSDDSSEHGSRSDWVVAGVNGNSWDVSLADDG